MQGLSNWIHRRARLHPGRVALVGPDRSLTYSEYDARGDAAARLLGSLGLGRGDRMALYMPNCLEWFELAVGAARLGAVIVPLNIRLTLPELQYQLSDSGSTLLAVAPELAAQAGTLARDTPVHTVLALGPVPAPAALPPGVAAADYGAAPAAAGEAPAAAVGLDDPFLICYTSGTTGKPKGAVLTHGNIHWNGVNNALGLGLSAADTILTLLPLFHAGGIGLFATPALYTGGRVVVPRRFDPAEALGWIEREQVTVVMVVPTIIQALLAELDRPGAAPADLSSLRLVCTGGAPCPPEVFAAAERHGLPFGQGYGMTEGAPTIYLQPEFAWTPPGHRGIVGKPGTIGKHVPACDVVLRAADGSPVPAGEVGEITVRGPNICAGYWQNPTATAAAFTPDGYFLTGDLAAMDADGYVTIMGRRKEMIISGGENIYPVEVELALGQHPAVAECAVLGLPDPRWGEVVGAAVALRPGQTATPAELAAFCRARLAGYKTPRRWLVVDALPKNPLGKVIKPQLVQQLQEAGT